MKEKRITDVVYHKAYYEANKVRIAEVKRAYRANNKVKIAAKNRILYYATQEAQLEKKQKYRLENKGKVNYLNTLRKKVVKQRTPLWLSSFDRLKIKCYYSIAAMLTNVNKESWHVDHIVPLQGEIVSGLHVPTNLQLLRSVDNIRKKNKFGEYHGQ
jgi:hypothetical protein